MSGPQLRVASEDDLEDSPSSAVAEPAPDDPMSQLEDVGSASTETPKKKCKVYYRSKRAKNNVTELCMPEFEPTSNPNRGELRTISVLALSTNSLWLSLDDIPWLVKWCSDELSSGGVPLELEDPADALECNCEADNVHIRWDFGGAWEAIILEGANRGKKVKTFVAKLDEKKWSSIGGDAMYGTDFENATPEQLKSAAQKLLEQHMKEVASPKLRFLSPF